MSRVRVGNRGRSTTGERQVPEYIESADREAAKFLRITTARYLSDRALASDVNEAIHIWQGVKPTAPIRRPVAGWAEARPGRGVWDLDVGRMAAQVVAGGSWRIFDGDEWGDFNYDAASVEAAQLAAEDALLAVLTDAAAVIGKRVVS